MAQRPRSRIKVCPDCGKPFVAHRRNGTPPGMLLGPHGLAINAGPMLRKAAAAIKEERLLGPTIGKPRPGETRGGQLVEGTCPRCRAKFSTLPKYGRDLCRCGWLLKIEPLMGGLSVDDVLRVFDPTGASGPRDPVKEKERLDEGNKQIILNWLKRGLARMDVSIEDGKRKMVLHLPTGTTAWDEAEERKRAQGGA